MLLVLLDLVARRDRTHLVPAFQVPTPSTGSGQALRQKREGWGTHCAGNTTEIKSLGHPPL